MSKACCLLETALQQISAVEKIPTAEAAYCCGATDVSQVEMLFGLVRTTASANEQ